jgi:ABC-2 type transport system ATP-binding protein
MVQAFRELLDTLKRRGDTTVLLSSHVLTEVDATCDRIGVIRSGRMVATGTLDELKRNAARRVTVDFREPVSLPVQMVSGVALVTSSAQQWVLDVQGPLGPLVQALSSYPVADLEVDSFKLEDYVVRHYEDR